MVASGERSHLSSSEPVGETQMIFGEVGRHHTLLPARRCSGQRMWIESSQPRCSGSAERFWAEFHLHEGEPELGNC